MKIFSIYRGFKGWIKLIKDRREEMITESAMKKAEIVGFFNKHGLKATIDAFKKKKSSIYSYRKKLRDSNGNLEVLNDKSRAPINRRKSKVSAEIIEFIKDIRQRRGDIGKAKIKILLDKYCKEKGIESVSESTIGRTIKRHNIYFYKERNHWGKLKKKKYKAKLRKNGYKPLNPGDLLYIDAVSLVSNGIRRYIITAVDTMSKIAFAYCYSSLSSKNATDFLQKLIKVAPFQINRIQTDNGSEFHHFFNKFLSNNNIIHYYSYPRHPQQNSYVERFNKTIQDEFITPYPYDLSDLSLLNYNIADYLLFYNTQRPHLAINLSTPIEFFISNYLNSKMYRTYAQA